jgi:hypothetical protein
MKYIDRVYGEVEINEPIILDLINSPSIQRLKHIEQAGYIEPYFPGKAFNRFEHSVGVYLLLKKYNAPIEEQIAGLIHDVSHSVFSHCIDYILSVGSETEHSHQDNIFKEFVKKTDIPQILEKYSFDIDKILDDNNFPLKEKSLPDLCADRIDYALRTALVFNNIILEESNRLLNYLSVEDNNWIFNDLDSAKDFANLFLKLNTYYFAGMESALMFRTVGDCVKYALEQNYISEKDLYTTDKEILDKVKNFTDKDQKLNLLWKRMNNKIKTENNPNDYDSQVLCKSRAVDPLLKDNNQIKRLSEKELEWKKIIEKESIPKKYFIKFEQ